MDKVVLVHVKSVYGKAVVYPANDIAECLAGIAGTKTLTARTLGCADHMGFEIKLAERDIQDLTSILGGPR